MEVAGVHLTMGSEMVNDEWCGSRGSGVSGVRGENGDGGIERNDDLKGMGEIWRFLWGRLPGIFEIRSKLSLSVERQR